VSDAASWTQPVRAHIERYIGPIDRVFSAPSAVEVHHVAPVETRPYHTLITVGMSSTPMQVPADVDAPRRIELMMTLPEAWPLTEALDDTAHWPTRLLQSLSRLPHERQSWLGWGHAVPNGEPPQPVGPDTDLCGAIIAPSLLVPVAFYELNVAGERVAFYSAIPLYREELELRQREGMEALLGRLLEKNINDVIDPQRRNVAKKRFWFLR
jgi:Suppressor of fused protein (SUFU)